MHLEVLQRFADMALSPLQTGCLTTFVENLFSNVISPLESPVYDFSNINCILGNTSKTGTFVRISQLLEDEFLEWMLVAILYSKNCLPSVVIFRCTAVPAHYFCEILSLTDYRSTGWDSAYCRKICQNRPRRGVSPNQVKWIWRLIQILRCATKGRDRRDKCKNKNGLDFAHKTDDI